MPKPHIQDTLSQETRLSDPACNLESPTIAVYVNIASIVKKRELNFHSCDFVIWMFYFYFFNFGSISTAVPSARMKIVMHVFYMDICSVGNKFRINMCVLCVFYKQF